jgi:hypothetical protein
MWPCSVINFLTIKPTRYTNSSNLFLEWNCTYFAEVLCPSSGVFHCTYSNGICHTGLQTACEQDQNGTSWSCSPILILLASCPQTCMTYTIAVCTMKTPDVGQRNCPKHVEFHSKNKFENLLQLFGFIVRKYCRILHGCNESGSYSFYIPVKLSLP